MYKDLPPQRPININIVHQNHFRPMLVYITYEIEEKMRVALHDEDMTWDNFIQQACINFLNQRQKDQEEIRKYIAFSEMQLFEEPTEKVVAELDVYADESSSANEEDVLGFLNRK